MNAPLSYAQYLKELDRETTRYTRACNKLESRLLAFQKTCKHKNVIFHSTPIAGGYSWHVCTLCDKVIKEDPTARIKRISSLESQVKNLVTALETY